MIKKLIKNKTVNNSIWILAEHILQMIISFIITMITARMLGPANYGVLNYGASFVSFFLVITKLGLDSIVVNELINNPKDEGKILGTSLVMRLISSGISIIMIFILVVILKYDSKVIIVTSILQSIVLIFQAASFLEFWFQSKLRSKYVSIAKSIAYIIASIYKVFLLKKGFNVEWFALSTTIDYIIICVFLFIFYKKQKGQKLTFCKDVAKTLLSKSYHFIISGLMVVIYTQIDKIMIGSIINDESVGFYSAALTLCSGFVFVPTAIITSARPTIYNSKKINYNLYLKRIRQTFCLIFWICVAFSIFSTVFGNFIIQIIYGKNYMNSVSSLIYLSWSLPFSQIGSARGIWIVGESLNKYSKRYLFHGAVINIILNLVLINIIGIKGAAIATLVTELFTCIISPLFYKQTRGFTKLLIEGITFRFNGGKA